MNPRRLTGQRLAVSVVILGCPGRARPGIELPEQQVTYPMRELVIGLPRLLCRLPSRQGGYLGVVGRRAFPGGPGE
jgi:hypothetical protein